jgi:hypothetical protein
MTRRQVLQPQPEIGQRAASGPVSVPRTIRSGRLAAARFPFGKLIGALLVPWHPAVSRSLTTGSS